MPLLCRRYARVVHGGNVSLGDTVIGPSRPSPGWTDTARTILGAHPFAHTLGVELIVLVYLAAAVFSFVVYRYELADLCKGDGFGFTQLPAAFCSGESGAWRRALIESGHTHISLSPSSFFGCLLFLFPVFVHRFYSMLRV